MTATGLDQAREKMRRADVPPTAIDVFTHYYGMLESGETGVIPEADVDPLGEVPHRDDVTVDDATARKALAETVVIKLNGGLGTSMGMQKAKSLVPVRGERTFLDLAVEQVLAARARYDVRLPLALMNSFRTRDDTLEALGAYPDLAVEGLPLDFLQNQEPKLRAEDLTPIEWPADPSLEWCPPGHGDLYTALHASGMLHDLLAADFRYASVSNADNLGAVPDARIAGWFAASGAGFAAEVARRTPADRKGGHLVRRSSDGHIVLRETAQVAPGEESLAADIDTHPYFNTNNLWIDLRRLSDLLESKDGVLPLPLIRNEKTVDPSDPGSPGVIQVESAMGAAIELFDDAAVIEVGRDRFLPVKTTNDLLVLRSDVYAVGDDAILETMTPEPLIDLDADHFKALEQFDARFAHGVPSLVLAESFTVRGDWTFGAEVSVVGHAVLDAVERDEPDVSSRVPDDATVGADGIVEPYEKRDVPVDLSEVDGDVAQQEGAPQEP